MSKPVVIIVGADKGGVGKTTVTRALLDYLASKGFETKPYDTEAPDGDLLRFYPTKAEVVDFTESNGQMKVLDNLGAAITVIDIRAGLLTKTLETLSDIGFVDPAKYSLIVLHVLSNSQMSIAEVKAMADRLAGITYIQVGNRINKISKFEFPAGALEIPPLDPTAYEAVDTASVPFSIYAKDGAPGVPPSAVLRGYVGKWLERVYAQFVAAKLV
jgi:hypothetical protein